MEREQVTGCYFVPTQWQQVCALPDIADRKLALMDEADLDRFEALMEAPDDKLWTWILGSEEPDAEFAGPMLDAVIAFGREELA